MRWLALWPNGDVSVVEAPTAEGIFDLMDEVGDPSAAKYVRISRRGFAVHFPNKGKWLTEADEIGWLDEETQSLTLNLLESSGDKVKAEGQKMIAKGLSDWYKRWVVRPRLLTN
jgi:hypothetical protein